MLCNETPFSRRLRAKQVQNKHRRTLLSFLDKLEICYSQLAKFGQTSVITANHIDDLADKHPMSTRELWKLFNESFPVE